MSSPQQVVLGAGTKPSAPKTAPKPRLMSGRKPAGKTGGLGVKKMSKQVDSSLFDQAPEEQAPPAPAVVCMHSALACFLNKQQSTHSLDLNPFSGRDSAVLKYECLLRWQHCICVSRCACMQWLQLLRYKSMAECYCVEQLHAWHHTFAAASKRQQSLQCVSVVIS